MPGNIPIGLIIFSLSVPLSLIAQNPEILQVEEAEFLYQDEGSEIPQELFERYTDLRSKPLNINCTSPDQLAESELFSPYQIHTLINYREKHGDLYSILELASLRGFSLSRVQKISQFLKAEPCIKKENKARVKHMILLHAGHIFPKAEGFGDGSEIKSDSKYVGSPVATDVRIRSQLGNSLSLGFTYEKDAGESYFYRHKPEYLSGYLQYHGYRQLSQVIIGNFKLHQGLGLVNGTGFIHSPEGYIINRTSMMRLKPYSSKSESRYERGLGVRLALRNFKLMYWASYRNLDLGTGKLNPEPERSEASDGESEQRGDQQSQPEQSQQIDWEEHIRETGLHRTTNELSGRNLGYRFHSGAQALYRHKQLDVGILFGLESAGLSRKGVDALGFTLNRGLTSFTSLHGDLHMGKWNIFSEFALSDFKASALLAGATWHLNDYMQGGLILHRYNRDYRGSFPSSYAYGSKISNEMGVAMHLQLEPGQQFLVSFTGEAFHFPGPRFLCSVPSSSYKYGVTIKNSGAPEFNWRVRVTKKIWQTTPAENGIGLHSIKTNDNSRWDLRFIYDHQVQWQSRLIISYGSSSRDSYPGYALAQQISILARRGLRTTIQFVAFEVPEWDNRIYLHEPGLYYDFSFPVLYGSGQKVVATLKLKPKPVLSISWKLALTSHRNRDTLGSGNDLILGNEKWLLALQLRLDL
jgi:hypothetical protein